MTVSQRIEIEQTKRNASRARELANLIEKEDVIHIRFGSDKNELPIGLNDRLIMVEALRETADQYWHMAVQLNEEYR